MTTQWRALLASALAALLGTAGILRAATSAPTQDPRPPVERPMPGMHMHHGAAGELRIGRIRTR